MVVPSKELELSEAALWLAEQNPTGFLVALWFDPALAEKLALPDGESPDALHITLAYCGDAAELGELGQAKAITAVADAVQYRSRLEGKISGYGRFSATDSSDGKDVFYLTPDIPTLSELRQCIVNCLFDCGVPVSTRHGYSPHATLSYLSPDAPNPIDSIEDYELVFDGVTILAGTRRIDIPFWASEYEIPVSMSETGELPPTAILGSQPARALYFGSFDKEWIPFLPKPGTYHHEVYGDMDLTTTAYEEMLRNFDHYVYKQDLPIRATHTPGDTGAVGWIKPGGMRLGSDGSLEVKPEWNELGRGLVEDDRFKYVSAEFCKVWTNPVTQERTPNVAIGLALVTRPHFKTDVLNPLSASEALAFEESSLSGDRMIDDGGVVDPIIEIEESGDAGEGTQMAEDPKVDTPIVPVAEAIVAPAAAEVVAAPAAAAVVGLALEPNPAVTLGDLTQIVLSADQRQKERQMFSDLTARVELAERGRDTAEAALKVLNTERRTEKFKAEVLGRSAENGQPWFGPVEQNVGHLVSLSETYGDDSAEVRWAVTQKRNEAQAIKATHLFEPIALGTDDDGPSIPAQVTRLAEQYRAADSTLTMEKAISRVYTENPDLYIKSLKK